MSVYLVTYDLIKDRDYKSLHNKIKSYGTWAKALESVWFLESNSSARQIRDDLASVMDYDDKLLVIEVKRSWGTLNLPEAVSDWMNQNIL